MPKALTIPSHSSRVEPYSLPKMSTTSSDSMSRVDQFNERPSTAWSTEDDKSLMQYRQQGLNWGPIAEHFPGKTPNACRKRHERLMERKSSSEWDTIKTEDLAAAYFECREQMWRIMAEYLGENKWQTLETKCMEKGFKNLQTAARGARRGSNKYGSPGSDEFDDSGMADMGSRQHTPPQVLLPPPRESPGSRASPAHQQQQPQHQQQQQYAYGGVQYPIATSIEARPAVLSSANTTYSYPPYTAQSAYGASYGTPATSAWSAASASAISSQRLPSLSQELNFLPPVHFGGVRSNHIATSTYG